MRSRRGSVLNRVITGVVAFLLVAPIFVVVVMSFTTSESLRFPPQSYGLRWYQEVINDPTWHDRLATSLQTGVLAAVLATSIGTLSAYAITKAPPAAAAVVSAFMIAPLVVPVVVLGTGDFFVWANGWDLGPLHIGGQLIGTLPGLVLAHTVVALPYPFITVRTSMAGFDPTLERAAQNLGAPPLTVFRTVTLPLIAPGVLSGAVFAFIASWDEVVIASFLSTSRLTTVPVQIFNQLREALDPSAAVISTLLLLVSLTLIGAVTLARRGSSRKPQEAAQ